MKQRNRLITRVLGILMALCLIVGLSGCLGLSANRHTLPQQNEQSHTLTVASHPADVSFEAVQVDKVVDGDTISVVMPDGSKEKVRLIGINCPESVHTDESKNTSEGKAASDFTKSLLGKGDTVYLQKDVSETDKYDRLLRYVWLEQPNDLNDGDEICDKMLNAVILMNGHAEVVKYPPDELYYDFFKELK